MFVSSISANWADRDSESLLWLASYPRSGNTFTRILLANYFADNEDAYDINRLFDFAPSDTSGTLWRDFSAEMAGPSTFERTWKTRPDFIRYYRRTQTFSALPALKTHTANVQVSGQGGFEFRKNDRALYIVRHPLDVLLSYSDYNGRDIETSIKIMTSSGFMVFHHEHGGGYELRGSWAEHVSSWVVQRPCSVLLIRYEELLAATDEVLSGILDFIGAPVVPARIKRAVEASRFENIRKQDAQNKFVETPDTVKSGSVFRKGTSLQWLRDLAPEQAYRLADLCEPVMRKLGYTHPRDVLFDGSNALVPIDLNA